MSCHKHHGPMVVDGICNEVIQVKRFRLEVVMPRRGTVDVAGFDLTVAEVVIVVPQSLFLFRIEKPMHWYVSCSFFRRSAW